MKAHLQLFFIFISCQPLFSQINLDQIIATVQSSGNTATVSFSTQSNFINSGESSNIKVFFQMPASQTSSSTSISINSSFPFALTTNVVVGSIRYMFLTATFSSGFQLNTWSPNQTYEIGQFTFNNFVGTLDVTMYSANQSGSSWNGTSMTKINSGNPDNLVSWPVNQSVALPINIKTFSVVKDGERNAQLDWTTSSEINSDFFGIERSSDGLSWDEIAKVDAAGNSTTERQYAYLDSNLPLNRDQNQVFYYRLRLVDIDGQYKYSDVRGVNFRSVVTDLNVTLYPNPATQWVNIELAGLDMDNGDVQLNIFDMSGRQMIHKPILGNGIEPVDVAQLPAGVYQVSIAQGSTQFQKQFIKID